MLIALVHKHYDPVHLAAVIEQMRTLGAPVIRAVDMGGYFAALEGCHRLRAAARLGLTPVIEPVEYSEDVTVQELGLDFQDEWTVAQIADGAARRELLEFED